MFRSFVFLLLCVALPSSCTGLLLLTQTCRDARIARARVGDSTQDANNKTLQCVRPPLMRLGEKGNGNPHMPIIYLMDFPKSGSMYAKTMFRSLGFQVCEGCCEQCRKAKYDLKIGMVRDPWRFYVSMWAARSRNWLVTNQLYRHDVDIDLWLLEANMWDAEEQTLCQSIEGGCETEGAKLKFREWMRLINKGGVNWLTRRMIKAVTNEYFDPSVQNSSMIFEARHKFSAMNMTAEADCWVQTETLETDLKRCIENSHTSIDWDDGHGETNPSVHGNDIASYYDADTISLVLQGDAGLINKFNFPSHP